MQLDFHYYCIAVLARAAGFDAQQALVIAHASQYVDDSTESELIRLNTDGGDLKFDPVRTSYSGLEAIHSLGWSAQKRVWIPFHFLPPQPFVPLESEHFSFVTAPGSPFALLLLQQAATEPLANQKRRLCRIGVALHTLADSWAHQGFSGRQNRIENDVENIRLRVGPAGKEQWRKLGWENVLFDALPQIGHAEAGYFPDLAFAWWGYDSRQPAVGRPKRNNVEVFMDAAHTIYDQLRALEEVEGSAPQTPWDELAPKIEELFSEGAASKPAAYQRWTLPAYRAYQATDVEARCRRWREAFKHLFEPESFVYEKTAWREAAIDGETDWDSYSQDEWARMLPLDLRNGFWDSLWVHFHRAALRQRHFVLENLP